MTSKQPFFIAWRFYLILALLAIAVLGLIGRMFDLSILNQGFLRKQGDERVLRLVSTPAFRGMIVDRNDFPLAVSTTVYSVWINPKEFIAHKKALRVLGQLLDMKPQVISQLANHSLNKNREFAYLKRGISPERAAEIQKIGIPGVYTQKAYRRYYPEGETTSHLVGFTNIDDQGQEGVELAFNPWLQGEPGKKWVIKDRLGRIISDVETLHDQKPGHQLSLSIDRRIQYLAYRELMTGVLNHRAVAGSAIVLDVQTGEILAMVNLPSFNPNQRPERHSEAIRNRAVTDVFEPGSTIKAFSIASALDSGKFKPDSIIDTSPGWMRIGKNMVKDERNNGKMTIAKILQISSNVGVTKMMLDLPPDQLWSLLHRVGFGEITGVGFPGEQGGSLMDHPPWGAFSLATLAFGYGISVTALQLARAYAIIANDGVKLPITLLRRDKPLQGERVMEEKVAREMMLMLESVATKGGTGEKARVPGYRIAGKTGTAKMVGTGGYERRYTASFVGMAPLTHPQLVVAVVIHDPRGKDYLGGAVAGPVFERIMEGTLRILDIPPDAS